MTDAPSTPVIEIRDLHKSYGQLEVLKGVYLVAPRGHVVSLIGSSGSGKSTLLRCCNLLEESQQGEIKFEGETVRWRGTGHDRHPAKRPAPASDSQARRPASQARQAAAQARQTITTG